MDCGLQGPGARYILHTYLDRPLVLPGALTRQNFSLCPVLGDPIQLLPSEPRLRDVCLKVTSPGVFWPPLLSLALRVSCQCLSCNIAVWLSQGVAKSLPSSLNNV